MSDQHVQAAHIRWSRTTDRRSATAAARAGLLAKLDATIPPEIRGDARDKARRNALLAHYAGVRAAKARKAAARRQAELEPDRSTSASTRPACSTPAKR